MQLTNDIKLEILARNLDFSPVDTIHTFARQAFVLAFSDLREALRQQAWRILRSAYRQITPSNDDWFRLSVGLDSETLSTWVMEHESLEEIVAKPGTTDVWLLRKTKSSH